MHANHAVNILLYIHNQIYRITVNSIIYLIFIKKNNTYKIHITISKYHMGDTMTKTNIYNVLINVSFQICTGTVTQFYYN